MAKSESMHKKQSSLVKLFESGPFLFKKKQKMCEEAQEQ